MLLTECGCQTQEEDVAEVDEEEEEKVAEMIGE